MRNRKKRIWLALLLGICAMGVTGCMSKKEVDRQALEKFKEKYATDCDVIYNEVIDDSVENRDEIHVYVDKWMEKGETAVIYSWKEGDKAVSEDNLFGFIIRKDYENRVKELAGQQFSEAKAYIGFVSATFPDELTQDNTLEDAYSAGEKMITYMDILVVSKDDKETFSQKGEKFCSALAEAGLYGSVKIYALSEEAYKQAERMNYEDTISVNGYEPDGVTTLDVYRGKSFAQER